MKIHRLLLSLRNVLATWSSSHTAGFQMRRRMTQYLNHDHPEGLACKYKNFEIHIAMSSILNFPCFSGNCLDLKKQSKRYAQLPIEVNGLLTSIDSCAYRWQVLPNLLQQFLNRDFAFTTQE